ncbi:MAG: hypothetical protein HC906_03830 [Bacteroidales bacterium]|nr:hypothetical protein [Bacteroidales bacterium]
MERFTFKKFERLTSKILIDRLFSEGKIFVVYPLKIFYLNGDFSFDAPAQVLISVPKKNFKKAVSRNLIKRRLRESVPVK